MMKRYLMMLGLAGMALTQVGWSGYVTSYGASVHWTDAEIPFVVDSKGTVSVPGDAEFMAIMRSFDTWNGVECTHPDFVYGGKVTGIKAKAGENEIDGNNLIIWEDADEWTYSASTKTIALTTLFYNPVTGVAEEADMELADAAYTFTVTDGTEGASTDVENTITHELGHVLGLDHSTVQESTMYYSSPNGEISKRDLDTDDITGLCVIYEGIPTIPDSSQADAVDAGDSGSKPNSASDGGCTAGRHGVSKFAVMALSLLALGMMRRARNRRIYHV